MTPQRVYDELMGGAELHVRFDRIHFSTAGDDDIRFTLLSAGEPIGYFQVQQTKGSYYRAYLPLDGDVIEHARLLPSGPEDAPELLKVKDLLDQHPGAKLEDGVDAVATLAVHAVPLLSCGFGETRSREFQLVGDDRVLFVETLLSDAASRTTIGLTQLDPLEAQRDWWRFHVLEKEVMQRCQREGIDFVEEGDDYHALYAEVEEELRPSMPEASRVRQLTTHERCFLAALI